MTTQLPLAIIIEPNASLESPYAYMESSFRLDRHISTQSALLSIAQHEPTLVSLSASFSMQQSLDILTAVKHKSVQHLIPFIFVVDLSHKISSIPGTTWGNKLGILSSTSDVHEYNSILNRIMNAL